MSALRLDLVAKTYLVDQGYKSVDRWTWRLWSGSRIVSTSGSQLYSRRIDCARGAEVGAGLRDVAWAIAGRGRAATRQGPGDFEESIVDVRILNERTAART